MMNMKNIYIWLCIVGSMLLMLISCQQEKEDMLPAVGDTASLTMQFNLTPTSITRGDDDGIIQLNYLAQDGELIPCEAPTEQPATRVGDGNAADGGGMKDLTVFLVDKDNKIVGRQSVSDLESVTTQTISFVDLVPGEYTAYAYANTEGNDWFEMPDAAETSFADYENALLQEVPTGVPTLTNPDRMPLTGKQTIMVGSGNNISKIAMIRPVGKLSVTIKNKDTTKAVSAKTPTFGEFIPKTGYVFKHKEILGNGTNNPYHGVTDDEEYAVLPSSEHVVYESLLYETTLSGGITFSMSYGGADYTYQENFSDNLQKLGSESIIVKLFDFKSAGFKEDMFLRLDQVDGKYQLGFVTAMEMDNKCFWMIGGSGKQQRWFVNKAFGVSINLTGGVSFDTNNTSLKYQGASDDSIIIGEGSNELTYYPATDTKSESFGVSSDGTKFQFFTYVENSDGFREIEPTPITIKDINSQSSIPLTTILRNQHVQLNIVFPNTSE